LGDTLSKKNFFRSMVESVKDLEATMASDAKGSAEFTGFVDTGCYPLNGLLSGTIFGGAADNKVTVFAGETSVGKTFFVMGIVKHFLDNDPNAGVNYMDTESAVTTKMMLDRGIDADRVIRSEPEHIQGFRHGALKMLDAYLNSDENARPPFMMVLDSLGMMPSIKEITDMGEGKDTRDMTKPTLLRGAFRVLRLRLAKAKVPMLVTNHTYASIGAYVPTQIMSGGGGLAFASDSICFLSKAKDRDGKEVIGNIITARMFKSRMSRENQLVKLKLNYDTGLDKYYGLLDIAEAANIFQKVSTKYLLPDGRKVFGKEINENPTEVYNEEILHAIDAQVKKQFQYGSASGINIKEEVEVGE
jgi:RecA/RadA recombinase